MPIANILRLVNSNPAVRTRKSYEIVSCSVADDPFPIALKNRLQPRKREWKRNLPNFHQVPGGNRFSRNYANWKPPLS
jgi:hypothetical protein